MEDLRNTYTIADKKTVAGVMMRAAVFVHPDIVDTIREENAIQKEVFRSLFGTRIPEIEVDFIMDTYLYDGSDCVFPSVRRHIGDREIVGGLHFRRGFYDNHYALVDDNRYPRHIWTYLNSARCYNKKSWASFSDFELAHIFPHKPERSESGPFIMYSKFTSASNTVLFPRGLAKPTDNDDFFRHVFQQICKDLYGLKDIVAMNTEETEAYDSIVKTNPNLFLPLDWKERMKQLFTYRMSKLYAELQKIK